MNRISLLSAFAFGTFALSAAAQNMPPVVTSPIADFTEYAGTPAKSIDLTPAFSDPDVSNAVRLTTVLGDIDIALFGQQKPITVTNFLKYVDQSRYFLPDPTNKQIVSSFVHRSISGFTIQGGGYIGTVDPSPTPGEPADTIKPTQVSVFNPIQNEPGISNKRGTIAMAQTGSDANSATSQWFINLADNGGAPTNLDIRSNNTGPYTVFGKVVNGTMSTVDSIAAVTTYNLGAPYESIPLRDFTPPYARVPNLVSIPAIAQISPFTFSATSDNSSVSVALKGTNLLVTGNSAGSAHVTVTATDFDGASISQMFTVTVTTAPGRLVNLSTRMEVGTGDNALIAGFIIRGSTPKRLAIRALGPTLLEQFGIAGALEDPVLELRASDGSLLASNDDWADAANMQEMIDLGLDLSEPFESEILATVPVNGDTAYTAVVRGYNDITGVGVVEVYDLDSGPGSTLLNISTRGQVGTDPHALIGGFTLGGTESKTILVRAIGPSLSAFGVANALVDPTLELHNAQGGLVDSNNDWIDSPQKTQIQNSGLAPTNTKESAIVQLLPAGAYTAVVHGTNGGTGVGSVEVYQLP